MMDKMERKSKMAGFCCYKKLGVMLFIIMLLSSLCGCSLAIEDAGAEPEKSRDCLVGAFITTEYVDTFDVDSYLDEHADEIITGIENGSISDGDIISGEEYQNRIYATIHKKDSERAFDWEFSFGDIEGMYFFEALFQEDGEPCSVVFADDAICDIHSILETTDAGENIEIQGTIYALLSENDSQIFYLNPIYQTPSGEIYMVAGNGDQLSGGLSGAITVKMEEETTREENGIKEIYSGAVQLSIEILNAAPEKITLYFMNENMETISTEEFAVGEMPEQVLMAEGAVFVIVETQWEDGTITRELFEKEDEESISVETFSKVSDKMLMKQMTDIVWELDYGF